MNCSSLFERRDKPSKLFYIFYVPTFVIGWFGNCIIFLAYLFWQHRVMVKRPTANFLLRCQNVLDCLACITLVVNVGTNYYEAVHQMDYRNSFLLVLFYSYRNLLLGQQMLTLCLTGCDRMMSIRYPLAGKWTKHMLKRLFFTCGILFAMTDVTLHTLSYIIKDCTQSQSIENIYSYGYAIFALLLLLLTYVTYALVFPSLYEFWKRRQRRQSELEVRVRTYTVPTVSVNDSTMDNEEEEVGEDNNNGDFITQVGRRSEEIISTNVNHFNNGNNNNKSSSVMQENHSHSHSHSYTITGNATGTLTASSPPLPPSSSSTTTTTQLSTELRLALILFSVSLSHTLSILPLCLNNLKLIHFPGYSIYYLFYLNGVVNPTIHFITRPELREYLRCLFTKPRMAFTFY